jgi:hypothetical protein
VTEVTAQETLFPRPWPWPFEITPVLHGNFSLFHSLYFGVFTSRDHKNGCLNPKNGHHRCRRSATASANDVATGFRVQTNRPLRWNSWQPKQDPQNQRGPSFLFQNPNASSPPSCAATTTASARSNAGSDAGYISCNAIHEPGTQPAGTQASDGL